jgi:AcrR family transcriptional regulator
MISPSDVELPEPTGDGGAPDSGAALTDLHLWKLPRGRHGLPPELVAQSQRERLLAAVVRVTASKGYRASSVADILKDAGVGRETFYRHFKDKEDCFLAANDALIDNLENQVAEAYEEPGAWTERVRRGLAVLLDWFAANPELARVMMIEMGNVGPVARKRFHETFHRFTARLDEARDQVDDAPDLPNLISISGGAVFACIYDHVALGDAKELPQMLPDLTFELFLPSLGEAAAADERRAAAEDLARKAETS